MIRAHRGSVSESAARRLADEIVRAQPVTMASVALWNEPSFSLTVEAVSTPRQLGPAMPAGGRVPLSTARWHRQVFERQEPVLLEQDSPERAMAREEFRFLPVPDLRSVFLVPILFAEEIVGVLALGEGRSRSREPFTEEKRRRCLARLDAFMAESADSWEAGRLRRHVGALSFLVRTVREVLGVRTEPDLLAVLATGVAEWLGVPVRGLILATPPDRRAHVVARWALPPDEPAADAVPLVLALARATALRPGPVSVARLADDPVDPLNLATDGQAWTRIALPLLRDDRLLGIVCLYAQDDVRPIAVEAEALRWLAEMVSGWMSGRSAVPDGGGAGPAGAAALD
jgi:GAF domain-containing protein